METATFTVERTRGGTRGRFGRFVIMVDGARAGTVGYGKQISVQVEAGHHEVHLSCEQHPIYVSNTVTLELPAGASCALTAEVTDSFFTLDHSDDCWLRLRPGAQRTQGVRVVVLEPSTHRSRWAVPPPSDRALRYLGVVHGLTTAVMCAGLGMAWAQPQLLTGALATVMLGPVIAWRVFQLCVLRRELRRRRTRRPTGVS